jgi:hypothetical protein
MEDFRRDFMKKHLPQLSPEEQREVLESLPPETRLAGLPPETRLAGLSPEQIRRYLDLLAGARPSAPSKARRKK